MDRVGDTRIFPGMTATATADLSAVRGDAEPIYTVPSAAIVGDYKLEPRAWVVNEQEIAVNPRPMKVRQLAGGDILVAGYYHGWRRHLGLW